jgi:hypothetical protein
LSIGWYSIAHAICINRVGRDLALLGVIKPINSEFEKSKPIQKLFQPT